MNLQVQGVLSVLSKGLILQTGLSCFKARRARARTHTHARTHARTHLFWKEVLAETKISGVWVLSFFLFCVCV